MLQRRPRQFQVDSDLELVPGERVVIGIAEGSVLRAALRSYGVPLLLMLLGALLAQWFWPGDLAAVGGMLLGGFSGWLGLRGSTIPLPTVVRKETHDGIWLRKGV